MSKALARRVLAAIHGTDRTPNLFHPMFAFVRAHHRALARRRGHVRGLCVDLGSGDRYFERFYMGSFDQYLAVDYLPAQTSAGATRFAERRKGPEFQEPDIVADGEYLPLQSSCADTILLIEVLEHLPRPGAVLDEVRRVLKPGGTLLLTTPFALPEHAQPFDFYRYTQFGLRYLLETAGFKVSEVEQVTSVGGVVSYFLNMSSIVGTYRTGSGSRLMKLLLAPFFPLMWAAVNTWAICWDALFAKDGFTLNYFVLAEKRR